MHLLCTVGPNQQMSVHHSDYDFRVCVWLTAANAYLHSPTAPVVNNTTSEKYFLVYPRWGSSSVTRKTIALAWHQLLSYRVMLDLHIVLPPDATHTITDSVVVCRCVDSGTHMQLEQACSCFIFCSGSRPGLTLG